MSIASTIIILFAIATAVAIAAQRIRVPYTVALVLVGVALSALHLMDPPHLTKTVLFEFILPGLLFEAAFHLNLTEFRRAWRSIVALAVPGVVAAIALTAWILMIAFHAFDLDPVFTVGLGLVFGGLVAATDPIAVVALFKQLRAPARLTTLLESESLLNDGTAIVFLTLIVAYVSGETKTPAGIAWQLVTITGGGILVGVAVGFAATHIMSRVDDPMVEITLTVIAAYGSFVLSDALGVSGVLATVSAGMLCSGQRGRMGMTPTTAAAIHAFWEYLAFALNSIVFLLIGFEVALGNLIAAWREVGAAYLAALLAWGGLRGALSMVLALGVAPTLAGGTLLVTMTFGVVLLSLVVQGLSMPCVLKRLKLAA